MVEGLQKSASELAESIEEMKTGSLIFWHVEHYLRELWDLYGSSWRKLY